MIRKFGPVAVLAFALALPGAAIAADPAPQGDAAATPSTDQSSRNADKEVMGDPTRIICRKVEQIGTRLGSKRICATAAQWSAIRDQDRQGLEQVQNQRYVHNESGGT